MYTFFYYFVGYDSRASRLPARASRVASIRAFTVLFLSLANFKDKSASIFISYVFFLCAILFSLVMYFFHNLLMI